MYLVFFDDTLTAVQMLFLGFALFTGFAFEFINGFHDTANAVATVIYTKSLKAWKAVVLSGVCNFAGVMIGGTAVAFTIVHLLPVDIVLDVGSNAGLSMLLALLIAAIIWNFGTWFKGLPASSSHTLIGSIVGVGMAHSFVSGHFYGGKLTMQKLIEVLVSLLTSPAIGFILTFLLVMAILRAPLMKSFNHVAGDEKPGWHIRLPMILSSAAVSFSHGSNDGQKGMGIMMLILIGILPAHFAMNMDFNKFDIEKTREALAEVREILKKNEPGMNKIPSQENIESEVKEMLRDRDIEGLRNSLAPLIYMDLTPLYIQMDVLSGMLKGKESFEGMGRARLWDLRNNILMLDESVRDVLATERMRFSREDRRLLGKDLKFIRSSVEYVPSWVIIGVALSLGVGTMIGWKRVVVTIGEKIGKTHMTYGQGFAAQLVAALTIFMGNALGMPVSTTHVLSSGVAGGMVATKSGLHAKMLMNILVAWLLTLPMSMLIAGTLYALFRIAL